MQIDPPSNFHVDSSFSLSGELALNESTSRPLLSRISTQLSGEGSHHAGRAETTPANFGVATEALELRGDAFVSDEDILRSASVPERSHALPVERTNSQRQLNNGLASSPAQAFLAMFSPPTASSLPARHATVVAGYKLVQTIGQGGFSTVKKGVSSNGDVVAIKRVTKVDMQRQEDPDECRRQLDNEIEIWRTLKHEHILPLFDVERTLDADYFITLYCPAGSLFDILKREGKPALPQDDAGMLFRQVVRGLRYLHESARIVHGDIKLENVLVDEASMCRITDFGLARRMLDPSLQQPGVDCPCLHEQAVDHAIDRLRRFTTISHTSSRHSQQGRVQRSTRHRNSTPLGSGHETPHHLPHPHFNPGSLAYAAPELLSPPPPQCPIHPRPSAPSPAQDMWALGVLLYALLSGHLPFHDNFEPRLQMKILHGVYDPPPGIGHGAESVLRGCLERVVSERWTIDMVDDVAWGVGWGEAGNVSTRSPSRAPSRTTCSGTKGKKSRSRSRVRPYPEHVHALPLYGSDGSVFSSSVSRSRSRVARRSSGEGAVAEQVVQSPSVKTSFSSSTEDSLPANGNSSSSPVNTSLSPPFFPTRGRFSAKSPEMYRLRSPSRSQSQSHSRSHSTPETPPTPSDSGLDSSVFHDFRISRGPAEELMPSVPEKGEEVPRGRRRATPRREIKEMS